MKSQSFLSTNTELTNECLLNNIKNIQKAFPSLPLSFYDIFTDRINFHKLNDKRLTRAVMYVVDNCSYPTPTIANFIQADKEFEDAIPQFSSGPDR